MFQVFQKALCIDQSASAIQPFRYLEQRWLTCLMMFDMDDDFNKGELSDT